MMDAGEHEFRVYPGPVNKGHWVLAFYGYGQQPAVYDSLARLLQTRVGFAVMALPYRESQGPVSKEEFKMNIQLLVDQYKITRISGVSYSIGSRYNLILCELFPEMIKSIFLAAPDGIRINQWNHLATHTTGGHFLFRFLMKHPAVYQIVLSLSYRLGWLPRSVYTFSKWHVRDVRAAQQVYNTWMNMKNMIPDLEHINRNQEKFKFDIHAFFGKRDNVIPPRTGQLLQKKIPAALIHELNKGHNLLDEELFQHLATLI